MAEQNRKSQAEKVANTQKNTKNASKKADNKKPVVNSAPAERNIPVRFFTSCIFLGLFIFFLVIFFKPEGALVTLLASIIHGLIGRTGFIVSIPALLYLFFIHAFSGKRPVKMRSICIGLFILFCGAVAHLSLAPDAQPSNWKLLRDLYTGGINSTTGGVFCGGLAMIVQWLCGNVISYIIFIISAIFSLLGGMQITVTSIVRAIQNRPRPDWDEPIVERQEPAAVVVNHIANKRIEHIERQREIRIQQEKEEQ